MPFWSESDLKNWPYLCHSDWKKFRADSDRFRLIPSGSAQIWWVTGKTSPNPPTNLFFHIHDNNLLLSSQAKNNVSCAIQNSWASTSL